MRIVHFIDHLRPDGAQYVLHQLVQGLNRRGHQQWVICLNDSFEPFMIEKMTAAGAPVFVIGKLALLAGFGLLKVLYLLRTLKPDVAVTFLFASDVIGRPLSRLARVPRVVTSIQTHDHFYAAWQRWLVRKMARFSDLTLLNSHHIRDFAIQHEGASPGQLRVIYNSVDASRYMLPSSREKVRQMLGVPAAGSLALTVGRLTHQKGYDILLRAIPLCEQKNIYFVFAGVGEEEARLRALASELGVEEWVIFAGYRRDVPYLLAGVDLYIHPSRYEGMPIAVLEAMASACPVIATGVDGTAELIETGVTGWLVPPEDPPALARAIDFALLHPEVGVGLGRAAQNRVIQEFSEEQMLCAWEKHLTAA